MGPPGRPCCWNWRKSSTRNARDVCVELLFVDGEDWGPGEDKMYLGALHFAQNPGPYTPDYAILLDMIGDKNLVVYREVSSQRLHPELNDKVWAAAGDLGDAAQFPDVSHNPDGAITITKYQISDDHDSFNAAGIPAIDLIDFDSLLAHSAGHRRQVQPAKP